MDISDIKGTNSKEYYDKMRKRAIIVKENILGSSKQERFIPKDKINNLDVRDINHDGVKNFVRNTNPLDPIYFHNSDGL